MNAKLIIVGGKANKSEIALRLPTIIGRSRDADLTMAHPMVSRQHCELYEEGGLLKIRDLGSLNGTFVGEEQVREAELYPNAEFTIGPLTFRVEYDYVGGIATSPTPVADDEPSAPTYVEPVATEPGPGETERQTVEDRGDVVDVQQRPDEPGTPAASGPPCIAPSGGELPDFAAWDAIERRSADEQAAEEVSPQAEESPEIAPAGSSGQPDEPPLPSPGVLEDEPTAHFDAQELPPAPPEEFGGPLAEAETERPSPAEEESAEDVSSGGAPPAESEPGDQPAKPEDELDEFLKGLQ